MSIPRDLTKDYPGLGDWSILTCYRGSIAHGTYRPSKEPTSIDDKDAMAFCVPPAEFYLTLMGYAKKGTREIKRNEWDIVIYEIKKVIRLLAQGNPNVLQALWLNENHYIKVTDAGRLLLDNRDVFVGKHVYKPYVGYARSQLHRMTHQKFEGYMGIKRKAIVEKFGYDCYLEDETEFLTDEGWKRFDSIDHIQKLATVNTNTGLLEFQTPVSRIDKKYTGRMYIFEPYMTRFVVTKNHKLFVSPCRRSKKNKFSTNYKHEDADWNLIEAREIMEGYRSHFHIRRAPDFRKEDLQNVSDEYLSLAGLFISDGTVGFRDEKVKSIKFTQSNGKQEFFELADKLAHVFSIKRYDYEKETIWVLHGEIARKIHNDFGHSKKKRLPKWCFKLSERQVSILWKALLLGDGTFRDFGEIYYTSSEKLAGDIQAMLVSAGFHCSVYGGFEAETSYGKVEMYHVYRPLSSSVFHTLRVHKVLTVDQERKNSQEGFPVKEMFVLGKRVVCFEVPNGTLVTRSKGKVAIQGNCKNASHLIRILRQGIEFLAMGEMIVERPDAQELLAIKRGEWKLQQVKDEADRLFAQAEDALIHSKLPERPDRVEVNKLCWRVIQMAWEQRGDWPPELTDGVVFRYAGGQQVENKT